MQSFADTAAVATRFHAPPSPGLWFCWHLVAFSMVGCSGSPPPRLRLQLNPPLASAGRAAVTTEIEQISLGADHGCVLMRAGQVACWGDNYAGQLGQLGWQDGIAYLIELPPVRAIAAGTASTCAAAPDGHVCWGCLGGLGTGDLPGTECKLNPEEPWVPTRLPIASVSQLAVGMLHACGIEPSGRIQCTDGSDVFELPGAESAIVLAVGGGTACAITDPTAVVCWRLPLGRTPRWDRYNVEMGHVQPREIAVGLNHGCVRSSTGSVRCWSCAGHSDETSDPCARSSLHTWEVTIAGASSISSGNHHSCALDDDGGIWWWRPPATSEVDAVQPVRLSTTRNAVQLDCGGERTCAVMRDDTILCWNHSDAATIGTAPSSVQINLPTGAPPASDENENGESHDR